MVNNIHKNIQSLIEPILLRERDILHKSKYNKKLKYNRTVELEGTVELNYRIDLIKTLLNNAESKINHFDSLRQNNLTFALTAFAVLFNYSLLSNANIITAIGSPLILLILMLIFWLLDYRFNKYSEGWQFTRFKLIDNYQFLLHNPNENLKFNRYEKSAEEVITPFTGLKSMLHFLLFLGSIITLIIVIFFQIFK